MLFTHPNNSIETFAYQIDGAIGGCQIKFDLWILHEEIRQGWSNDKVRDPTGNADAQHSFWPQSIRCEHLFHGFDIPDQVQASFAKRVPVRCQGDLTRRALDQARAQLHFQVLDQLRDRRPGKPKGRRGLAEVQGIRHPYKCAQVQKSVHQGTIVQISRQELPLFRRERPS